MKRIIKCSEEVSDLAINDIASNYEQVAIPMYGDYQCSCGCGRSLGHLFDEDGITCYGVRERYDDDGFDWRMFTKECWDNISSDLTLDEIYLNYPPCSTLPA